MQTHVYTTCACEPLLNDISLSKNAKPAGALALISKTVQCCSRSLFKFSVPSSNSRDTTYHSSTLCSLWRMRSIMARACAPILIVDCQTDWNSELSYWWCAWALMCRALCSSDLFYSLCVPYRSSLATVKMRCWISGVDSQIAVPNISVWSIYSGTLFLQAK